MASTFVGASAARTKQSEQVVEEFLIPSPEPSPGGRGAQLSGAAESHHLVHAAVAGDGARTLRVALATLGCKVNQYDTATIETRLRSAGCEIVPFAAPADVYVVNSCTVTDRADAESRQLAR